MFYAPIRRIRTVDPFALPDLAKGIADLILKPEVASIHFSFGSVLIMPEGFRAVSDALRSGRVTVKIAPEYLKKEDSDAEYDSDLNQLIFPTRTLLWSAAGRSTAVHESTHVIADWRRRSTAMRSEEGAAYVAEAWYNLNVGGGDMSGIPEEVVSIAAAVRARASGSGPVAMLGSEINAVRREMAQKKDVENGHFTGNNGF